MIVININLILQGGGIKGLAYIGSLRYFEENNIQIDYISSSSVGAVFGCLICAGYNSYEIEDIINDININILKPKRRIKESFKNKGMYSVEEIEKLLDRLLIAKGKKYFKDLKIGNNYKLIIMATMVKNHSLFVLPYDLVKLNINPDSFPIAKAVAMSISVPLIYEPYKINNISFYDGGLIDNYPIWCFENAVALRICNDYNFFNSFKRNNRNNKIKEIQIDTRGFKAFEFKKGLENKEELFKRGYEALKYNFNFK